jgi:hypothetical protein
LTFNGFTTEALGFYPHLQKNRNTADVYNNTKHIFHEHVKPQLIELLSEVSLGLSSMIPSLDFDRKSDIGLPFIHGRAVNYAWGAITRENKTKHSDLQFYIALRYDYLRFGIFTAYEKKTQKIFGEIYRKINSESDLFLQLLSKLEAKGIYITTKIANDETGKPKPLAIDSKDPAESIREDGTFNIMTAIPIGDITNQDVSGMILDCFMEILPMYKFVLSLE